MPELLRNRFPEYAEAIRGLVKAHRDDRDEPLLMALLYVAHDGSPAVFEVVSEFGRGNISPEKEFIAVPFGSAPGFHLPSGGQVLFVFTSPQEFETAIREQWPQVREIRESVQLEAFEILVGDTPQAPALLRRVGVPQ